MSKQCHYSTLGLVPGASLDEIKTAYRKLVLQYHPDKCFNLLPQVQAAGEAITKKANETYEVFSDVDRKRHYDKRFAREKPPKNASPPPTAYKPPAGHSEPDFYSYAESGQFSWDHMSGKTPRSHGDKTYSRRYPGWGPESRHPRGFNPESETRKRARCEDDDNEIPPHKKERTEKNPLRWSPLPPRRWTALRSRFQLPRQPQPKPSSPDSSNSLPKANGIAVLENEIYTRIISWDFSIKISDKYVVLGDVRDMTVKDMHGLTMALGIVLEKNKDWRCRDTKDDVQLNIRKTPGNRDVTSISSLLKYEIRKNEDGFLMFVLTLSSPLKAPPRPTSQPWSFSFRLTTSHRLHETAIYTATSQMFSKVKPDAKAQENKRLSSYAIDRPEYRMQSIRQLKPLSLLDLGNEYFTVIYAGTERWYRLAAVGYHCRDSVLEGTKINPIDID